MTRRALWILAFLSTSCVIAAAVMMWPPQRPTQLPVIEPAPDFELINQDGNPVRFHEMKGSVKIMSFIYVKCHMANRCPLTTKNFRSMQELLADRRDDTVFLSITFDPESDTPGALRKYGELYGADFANWHFLTGSTQQIEAVCEQYQIIHERERPDDPSFRHSVITFLVDEKNDVRKMYFANAWKPEDVAGDVLALLD